MTVGERIKQRRKELGYNAEHLAAILGVSRSTMYRYENGDIDKLPVDVWEPLSHALQCTPAYLMGWSDACQREDAPYQVHAVLPAKSENDAIRKVVQTQLESAGILKEGQEITEEQAVELYRACGFDAPAVCDPREDPFACQLLAAYREVQTDFDANDIEDVKLFMRVLSERKKRG